MQLKTEKSNSASTASNFSVTVFILQCFPIQKSWKTKPCIIHASWKPRWTIKNNGGVVNSWKKEHYRKSTKCPRIPGRKKEKNSKRPSRGKNKSISDFSSLMVGPLLFRSYLLCLLCSLFFYNWWWFCLNYRETMSNTYSLTVSCIIVRDLSSIVVGERMGKVQWHQD